MEESQLTALAKAIDYPEEVPPGVRVFEFGVDDAAVTAQNDGARLVLACDLAAADDVDPARFAALAAGRCLKEEATLAYDPDADKLVLWQELPATADARLLRRFFETFLCSRDWWRARASDGAAARAIPEMAIIP